MRILFFTDPHNADHPPRMRKASYMEDILFKQQELVQIAKTCDLTICGGDVFHQKNPDMVSHRLVNRVAEIYREMGDMIIVPGNHDVGGGASETLWRYRPLNHLANLPNVEILHKKQRTLSLEWSVACYGLADAWEPLSEFERWLRTLVPLTKKQIVVAHIPFLVGKDKYPYPTIRLTSAIKSCAKLFFLGHMHDFQQVSGQIVAPGSLSRGVLKMDASYGRPVYSVVVNIDKGEIAFNLIKMDVKPADEVFRLDEKQKEQREQRAVGELLSFIDDFTIPQKLDQDTIEDLIKKSSVDDETKETALKILKEMS